MKKLSENKRLAGRVGLLLAAGILGAVISARADSGTPSSQKPYPMKKCVVDGKNLSKCGTPYVACWKGREVRLCCEKCLPTFQKHPAGYVRKIDRAEAKGRRVDGLASVVRDVNAQPGGLAWSGW